MLALLHNKRYFILNSLPICERDCCLKIASSNNNSSSKKKKICETKSKLLFMRCTILETIQMSKTCLINKISIKDDYCMTRDAAQNNYFKLVAIKFCLKNKTEYKTLSSNESIKNGLTCTRHSSLYLASSYKFSIRTNWNENIIWTQAHTPKNTEKERQRERQRYTNSTNDVLVGAINIWLEVVTMSCCSQWLTDE